MKSFRLWLSEQADTPKQAMQSAKEIEIGMIDNKAKKLYQEIIDAISSKKYQSAISYIDDIAKDPKLKFVLSLINDPVPDLSRITGSQDCFQGILSD